jgi:hypothetical protein
MAFRSELHTALPVIHVQMASWNDGAYLALLISQRDAGVRGKLAKFSAHHSLSSSCCCSPGHGWLRDMGPDDQGVLCLVLKVTYELDKFCGLCVLAPNFFCIADAEAALE